MNKAMVIQGRETTSKDIELVQEMIKANPSWGRSRLSKELAVLWNWRALSGQLKDMACRSFLLKLEERDYISLPAPRWSCQKAGGRAPIPYVPHKTAVIAGKLAGLAPLRIEVIKDKDLLGLFHLLLGIDYRNMDNFSKITHYSF